MVKAGQMGVILLLIVVGLSICPSRGTNGEGIAVLVCDSPWIEHPVDEMVQKQLEKDGFFVKSIHYNSLTESLLLQFNVVVMNWDVNLSPTGETPEEKQKVWNLIQRFVEDGGGLLIFGYHSGNPDKGAAPLNDFLKRFGARYLPQAIWEEDAQKRALPKGSEAVLAIDFGRQFAFARTENITPHPITKGVRSVWYPIGWMFDIATLPIEVDNNWTILVRGSSTAKSLVGFPYDPDAQKLPIIPSSPPFVACRQWGNGRVVIFASHPTFWIQAPYHRLWGYGFVYEQGEGWHLLVNILRWLAEPSLNSKKLGGYKPEPPQPKVEVAKPIKWQQPKWQHHIFKGLIGAHSSFSDGMGSVSEFCAAAKAAGYDFLVFTEDLQQLEPNEWEALVRECQGQSGDNFLAIPGIKFVDELGASYIGFALPFFPKPEWLSDWENRRRRHIANMPGFYFGMAWSPLAIIAPRLNPHPTSRPWFQKFYGAFSIFTYDRNRLVDESLNWYLERMGNQYNSVPIAVHEVFTPYEVALAKEGVQTYAWANSLHEVANSFKHHWYANPQMAFVSSGPILREWWIENPSDEFSKQFALHIFVQSSVPLREVRIYDGHRLWRRFVVRQKEFRETVKGWHDQQRFFVLVARDEKDGILVSPTLSARNTKHSLVMCTDMQNTLEGIELWHPKKKKRVGILTALITVTGWGGDNGVPAAVPWDELSPPGFDWNLAGARFAFSPSVRTKIGNEGGVAKVNIHFASPYLAIEDLEFTHKLLWGSWATPLLLIEPFSRRYHFTPRLYGYDVVLGEMKVHCKQTFTFAEVEGPNLLWLSLELIGGFQNWKILGSNGEKICEGAFEKNRVSVPEKDLHVMGCIVFSPGTAGGIAVYPLESNLVFRIEGNSVIFGQKLKGATTAGQVFTNRILLVRLPMDGEPLELAKEFGEIYGLFLDGHGRKWQLIVHHGLPTLTNYPICIKAVEGGVLLDFKDEGLNGGLPIFVDGLNDLWDAFVWRKGEKEFLPIGVRDGRGYFQFSQEENDTGTFYIGHIAICDNKDICLSVEALTDKRLRLVAQNNAERFITTIIKRAKGLIWLPYFERKIALKPGEKVEIDIAIGR